MQFRIFKIPVTVEPIFFFLVVLLGARRERVDLVAIWVGVVFVSILVHELGHAFAARRYGLVPSIRLHSLGGLTQWNRTRALSNRQSIWISFAGPLAGFALGGLVHLAHPIFQVAPDWRLSVVYGDLLWVNIGWSLINLLPILPLDGGNIALALLARGYVSGAPRTSLYELKMAWRDYGVIAVVMTVFILEWQLGRS